MLTYEHRMPLPAKRYLLITIRIIIVIIYLFSATYNSGRTLRFLINYSIINMNYT